MSVIILSGVPASSSHSSSLTTGGLTLTLPDATYGPLSTSQVTGLDSTILDLQTNVTDLLNNFVTGPIIAGATTASGAEWGVNTTTGLVFYASGGVWVATGPTAADAIPPAATDAVGAIGVLTTEFALEDHKHPEAAVSADALNSLSVGTDGLHYFKGLFNNLTATTAPIVTDDTASNYVVGSIWVDETNDNAYIAVDITTGAAVWLQISNTTSSLTVADAIPPAADDATGAIGAITTQFATEDHKHPAQGISADANNSLSVGADGLHTLNTSTFMADAISPTADDATGAIGSIDQAAREDHKHPAQGISADAVGTNLITLGGTDGLHLLDTSTFMADGIAPVSDDATGAIGSIDQAAREDHKHPAQGISADANNSLSVGADGLHYAAAVSTAADAISPAATDAVGAIGVLTTEFALEDHKHPAQGISADANNSLSVGADGLHYAAATIDEVIEFAGNLAGAPITTGNRFGINNLNGDMFYVDSATPTVWSAAASSAASNITNTPAGNISATDVQTALDELDTEKLSIAGGTMTGVLDMGGQTITNLVGPFDISDVHMFTATEYQTGLGGNGFLINATAAPVATTPTYSFVGAPTTGMWWNLGDIAFSISGTDQFVIGAADIDVVNKRIVQVADPVNAQDAVTLNYVDGLNINRVVGSATGVDLRTLATTNIYTVPVGKTLIITQIIMVAATNTPGTPSDPVISFGIDGATTSVVNNSTSNWGGISGAANQVIYLTPDDGAASPNAGSIVNITVNTAAGHSTLTGDIYIMGFEL
jgi:hypothetical protein